MPFLRWNEITLLSDKEQKFLTSQLKKEQLYLYFCVLDIIIALAMLFYMGFLAEINATRVVLAIILLINARSNLKQHKNICLLRKLSAEQ